MKNQAPHLSGTIGDLTCDGWVQWTTCDEGFQYVPALHCGAYSLLICRDHCIARGGIRERRPEYGVSTVIVYRHDQEVEVTQVEFGWHLDGARGFLAAVAEAIEDAEDCADLDHPAPHNVIDAARELWFAMMQCDAAKAVHS